MAMLDDPAHSAAGNRADLVRVLAAIALMAWLSALDRAEAISERPNASLAAATTAADAPAPHP
jgi:hypothetical protein